MIEKLTIKHEGKQKTAFYASDFGKPNLDLYFAFTGEAKSNPPSWNETLKFGAGKGVEMQMLRVLKDSEIVDESYDQEKDGRINFQREGIEIHGYVDAKMKDGTPIEIKSINNKNFVDIKKYKDGYPRENYVGQLAIYMDALDVKTGYLFVASVDGLSHFWFKCEYIGDYDHASMSHGKFYRCYEEGKDYGEGNSNGVVVNLDKQYKEWAKLYNNHVKTSTLPDVWQYSYKFPVTEINWGEQSKVAITKARNNQAVIGDYQVTYSDWKDKIVALQGETLGYNTEEIRLIKNLTRGYTGW